MESSNQVASPSKQEGQSTILQRQKQQRDRPLFTFEERSRRQKYQNWAAKPSYNNAYATPKAGSSISQQLKMLRSMGELQKKIAEEEKHSKRGFLNKSTGADSLALTKGGVARDAAGGRCTVLRSHSSLEKPSQHQQHDEQRRAHSTSEKMLLSASANVDPLDNGIVPITETSLPQLMSSTSLGDSQSQGRLGSRGSQGIGSRGSKRGWKMPEGTKPPDCALSPSPVHELLQGGVQNRQLVPQRQQKVVVPYEDHQQGSYPTTPPLETTASLRGPGDVDNKPTSPSKGGRPPLASREGHRNALGTPSTGVRPPPAAGSRNSTPPVLNDSSTSDGLLGYGSTTDDGYNSAEDPDLETPTKRHNNSERFMEFDQPHPTTNRVDKKNQRNKMALDEESAGFYGANGDVGASNTNYYSSQSMMNNLSPTSVAAKRQPKITSPTPQQTPVPFHKHSKRHQALLREEAAKKRDGPEATETMQLARSRVARREHFAFSGMDDFSLTMNRASPKNKKQSKKKNTELHSSSSPARMMDDTASSLSAAMVVSAPNAIETDHFYTQKQLRRRQQAPLAIIDELAEAGYDLGEMYIAQVNRDGTTPSAFCIANKLELRDFEQWLDGAVPPSSEKIRMAVASYVCKTLLRGRDDEATLPVHLASKKEHEENASLLQGGTERRDNLNSMDSVSLKATRTPHGIRKEWRHQTLRDGLTLPRFCELFKIPHVEVFKEWFGDTSNFNPTIEKSIRDYLERSSQLKSHFLTALDACDENVEGFCRRRLLPLADVTSWLSGRDLFDRKVVAAVWEYVIALEDRTNNMKDFSDHPPLLEWVIDTESPWADQKPAMYLPRLQRPFQSHRRPKKDTYNLERIICSLPPMDDKLDDGAVASQDYVQLKKQLRAERKKGLSRHDNESVAAETPFDPKSRLHIKNDPLLQLTSSANTSVVNEQHGALPSALPPPRILSRQEALLLSSCGPLDHSGTNASPDPQLLDASAAALTVDNMYTSNGSQIMSMIPVHPSPGLGNYRQDDHSMLQQTPHQQQQHDGSKIVTAMGGSPLEFQRLTAEHDQRVLERAARAATPTAAMNLVKMLESGRIDETHATLMKSRILEADAADAKQRQRDAKIGRKHIDR